MSLQRNLEPRQGWQMPFAYGLHFFRRFFVVARQRKIRFWVRKKYFVFCSPLSDQLMTPLASRYLSSVMANMYPLSGCDSTQSIYVASFFSLKKNLLLCVPNRKSIVVSSQSASVPRGTQSRMLTSYHNTA